MPIIKCRQCGKEVYKSPSAVLPQGNCCSFECVGANSSMIRRKKIGYKPWGTNYDNLYRTYGERAKARGKKFLISKDKFAYMTKQNCYYCGVEPSTVYPASGYVYNGIDRFDNDGDYVDGNVVTCCKGCNYGKRQMTINQFVEWIERVKKHFIDSGKAYAGVDI